MAIKRKKGGGGGGANWMDTYGDMVTLLLCFFVLLYSMCTISQEKWKAIVASFNPNAIRLQTEVPTGTETGPSADEMNGSLLLTEEELVAKQQEEIDDAIEALFQALKEYAEQSDEGKSIEVTKGDGYVFISFNDAVFFDGDSYHLRKDGEQVLASVSEILGKAVGQIDEVVVMGHTAQGNPNRPNNISVDRFLSSNRATVVTVYLQEHSGLSGARLVSQGNGQWRNVAPNDTSEERAKNRRVEIMITGRDLYSEFGDSLKQYESIRTGEAHLMTEREDVTSSD